MRRLLAGALLLAALAACAGALIADPYNTMGVGPEYLRPGVAEISRNFALAALGLAGLSAAAAFRGAAGRRGWGAVVLGAGLAFAALVALARLGWLYLSVFP